MQFFFFMKICLENFLGSDHVHENKTFFFFCFWKGEINLKILRFFLNFWIFYRNVSKKTEYFNTRSVSYSVKITTKYCTKFVEKHARESQIF